MDKYRVCEEQREGKFRWIAPKYYDHPDGEDLIGKLSFTTKVAFVGSSLYGLLASNRAEGAPMSVKLLQVAKFVVPVVGAAATFTLVTYYSTVLRKKDDPLNYAFGGIAAGVLLGSVIGTPGAYIYVPFYITCGAVFTKISKMQGTNLVAPSTRRYFPTYFTRNWDTSLLPEIPGNWTKGAPAK